MPESPSPFDDPFADLFGKLPDPRSQRPATPEERDQDRPVRNATQATSGSPAVAPAPVTPATGSMDASPAPLSRREARAAAAAAAAPATAPAEPTSPPTEPPTAATEPAPPVAGPASPVAEPAPPVVEPVEAPASPRTAADPTAAAPAPATEDAASPAAEPPVAAATPRAETAPTARTPHARPSGRRTPDLHAAASAGIEDLFTGERTTDELGAPPPPPNKRRRRTGRWIALVVVLVILGGAAGGGFYVWNTYQDKIRGFFGWTEPKDYADGQATGEAFVTISAGDTGAPISQTLFDAGVTKTPTAFYDYLISTGQNPPFVPGVFKLQKQMTSAAALTALLDPASKQQNGAAIPEGFTVSQTLQRLADGTGIPLADFEAAVKDPAAYGVAAQSLEGWLFPATYQFDPSATATTIIQRLVDRTIQSLDAAGVPAADRERILTTASIIQREARTDSFDKVSRVIQNRLDQGMKLEMDSTAQYGYGELHAGTASTSNAAQYDQNPWNTYVIDGLPVTPIANPGDAAIAAAMHPAPGPWLFFVTVNLNTGETIFSVTADEHQVAVNQWRQWCTDNPGSGC
ncbi:endolytic transglycosylase MltG [Microbacterium sp. CJ88]|uniref:endolytic transglycosylase MltG n=1 Tax=Microbacterium sp. CJ88 TaxID=3445672 RepID=UPI003F6567EE